MVDRSSFIVHRGKELHKFARDLWEEIRPDLRRKAVIVALEGELGAGKTTFTKALAKAMGLQEEILSPTFVLHSEYGGVLEHIDTWRIEKEEELDNIGLGKMIAEKKLIVIEWADKFRQKIQDYGGEDAKIIWIKMEYGEKENERKVIYEDFGD